MTYIKRQHELKQLCKCISHKHCNNISCYLCCIHSILDLTQNECRVQRWISDQELDIDIGIMPESFTPQELEILRTYLSQQYTPEQIMEILL